MDLTFIPFRDRFTELLVSGDKIWTIVWPQDFRDTSPCNEAMDRIDERISVHTQGNFYVYCSADQARKQHTVTFNSLEKREKNRQNKVRK